MLPYAETVQWLPLIPQEKMQNILPDILPGCRDVHALDIHYGHYPPFQRLLRALRSARPGTAVHPHQRDLRHPLTHSITAPYIHIVWQDAPITDRVPKDVAIMVWHIDGNNGATMDYLHQGRPVIQVTWTPCVYQPVKDVYQWNAWTKEMNPKLMLGAQLVLWELSGASAVPFLRYKISPRNERVWNS